VVLEVIETTAIVFEAAGAAAMVLGALVAFIPHPAVRQSPGDYLQGYRQRLGRGIVLGLEFLVAADILKTITTTPSLKNIAVLAGIVLIRTFLSFAVGVELEGRWPWARKPAPDQT
jgi:uncharacterized membrane protein